MKRIILLSVFFLTAFHSKAQEIIQSYIINIENRQVYLDLSTPKVKVGDVLSIRKEASYMIHPVTKKKIKKEGTILADLEIIETYKEYSVATVYPEEAISKIKVGMLAEMPELPQNYEQEITTDISQPKASIIVPKDTKGIISRYLQATGLHSWIGKKFPTYCAKKKIQTISSKGENIPYDALSIVIPAERKMFSKLETPKQRWLLSYSYVFIINENKGWIKFKKALTSKVNQESILKHLKIVSDPLNLLFFDSSKWKQTICGTRIEEGQNCTGIEFTSIQNDEKYRMYFSEETGLITYTENNDVKTKILDYKQYGDLLLNHTIQKTYSEGKVSKETEELQDFILNYPTENISFSKDALKDAF